jgi:VWFA-related protein
MNSALRLKKNLGFRVRRIPCHTPVVDRAVTSRDSEELYHPRCMKARIHFVSVLALLLTLSPRSSAQFNERIDVELVTVPVYVSVNNAPVRGLTRDNFELFVNGERQQIEYFDVTDFASASQRQAERGPEAPASPRQELTALPVPNAAENLRDRRLYLLAFDNALSSLPQRDRARRAAESFVRHSLPSDFFAIITFTREHGGQFLLPFTRNREAILRAIGAQSRSRRDPLHTNPIDAEHSAWFPMTWTGDSPVPARVDSTDDPAQEPFYRLGFELMKGLVRAANAMAPLEGFKHLIFFGTVIPQRADVKTDLMNMRKEFQHAGVYLDTVDLGGLRPRDDFLANLGEALVNDPAFAMADSNAGRSGHPLAGMADGLIDPNPVTYRAVHQEASESLFEVSSTTGGQWIHNRSDFGNALQDLSNAQQIVYTLAFHPHSPRRNNSITVKVHNLPSQATVLYRRGFSTERPNPESNALQLADIVINDTPQHGTPVAIHVVPTATGVDMQILVPVRALGAQTEKSSYATVTFYVFNERGDAVSFGEKNVPVAPGASNDVIIRHAFKLRPGRYVAKGLLRIGKPESIGFTQEAFVVSR